jgi:hypothetical protein
MAYIHTTASVSPTKLELLDRWLPGQPWSAGGGQPDLARAGGFRLDDPAGEVGIEFMFVRNDATSDGTTYQVPMTYRGAPLAGSESALIGTAEHGALGTRWIYDGVHDPVLVAQLVALLHGAAEPQHQSESDTPEPRVRVDLATDVQLVAGSFETVAGADGTMIRLARVLTVGERPESATLLANFEGANGHGALSMSGLSFKVRPED